MVRVGGGGGALGAGLCQTSPTGGVTGTQNRDSGSQLGDFCCCYRVVFFWGGGGRISLKSVSLKF